MSRFSHLADRPAFPDPDVDLYALAMALRSEADGSAEGSLWGDEPKEIRAYLERRLEAWGADRSESEALFRQFLVACIAESEQKAPWLFK